MLIVNYEPKRFEKEKKTKSLTKCVQLDEMICHFYSQAELQPSRYESKRRYERQKASDGGLKLQHQSLSKLYSFYINQSCFITISIVEI